jgi:hypothetical protein
MNRWQALRAGSIAGCVVALAAAVWISANCPDMLRGYGTFWTGAAAAGSLYFVVGYAVFSLGWRQSEEGSIILALVGLLSVLALSGFAIRVFLAPPADPTLLNVTVTIVFAWMMFWLSAVFTRRQVDSRREARVARR